jgi:hypothetical protein
MLRLVSTGIHSFPLTKDTREYGEASSLHVMREVMIGGPEGCEGNKKEPAGGLSLLLVPWVYD